MTTALPPSRDAASMVSTSPISRNETTPGRSAPGNGRMNGFEPVASHSRSYGTSSPLAERTVRRWRSIATTGSPACRVMP